MDLSSLEATALAIAIVAYLASLAWAIAHLASARRFSLKQGRVLILVAFAVHTAFLVMRAIRYGGGGWIIDISETFIVITWCMTLVYMLLDRKFSVPALPAFFIPINVLLTIGAAIQLETAQYHVAEGSPIERAGLYVHILAAMLSYALFAIGVALGIMYLIQERQLKRKRTGALFRGLPSLENNEKASLRVLAAGFVCLTLSLVVGGIWAQWTGKLGEGWFYQPKILFASLTWVFYAVLMHASLTSWLAGRRLVYMTIGTFVLVLFTYIGTPLLLGDAHGSRAGDPSEPRRRSP